MSGFYQLKFKPFLEVRGGQMDLRALCSSLSPLVSQLVGVESNEDAALCYKGNLVFCFVISS